MMMMIGITFIHHTAGFIRGHLAYVIDPIRHHTGTIHPNHKEMGEEVVAAHLTHTTGGHQRKAEQRGQ